MKAAAIDMLSARLPVYPFTRLPVYPSTRLPADPTLGSQPVHHTRKRRALADVRRPTNPRHGPLESQSVPRVHERAVLSQVEIPTICVHRQAFVLDALQE